MAFPIVEHDSAPRLFGFSVVCPHFAEKLFCRLLKRPQRLGARRLGERKRMCGVRCSETNKRNEAYESFQQPG